MNDKDEIPVLKPNSKVLIVDDDIGIRETLKDVLEMNNIKVECAGNGKEGMDLFKKTKYSLVLMDIKMPVQDGITTLEMMKKECPDAIIIMMTAYTEEENLERAKKLGACKIMTKPFNLSDFFKHLFK